MEQLLFIKEYYIYLFLFLGILFLLSILSHQDTRILRFINFIVVIFSIYTCYFFGFRDIEIGVDNIRYEKLFNYFKNSNSFEFRKDFFYDLLTYICSKFLNYAQFLTICAFFYVFGGWYSLKKIFKDDYFLPFIVFLISPYFIANGISAMRSGIAASFFLIAISKYYETKNLKKSIIWMLVSLLFHFSMFIPLLFFIIAKYFKNTRVIFILWLLSIGLGALNINVIKVVVQNLGLFEERISNYAELGGERNFWMNFAIFGFFPVIIAIYNVLILDYKNNFFSWLLNGYMLIHIPYIILLNSEYGLRLGYLAEFMMPILLLYPFLIAPKFQIKFYRIKLTLILMLIFSLKAYKIIIV